jgi:DNA modification methylase
MFSFAGDVVLDPFAGTGTTNLGAIETGRNSVGVEIEPKYLDLIEKRLSQIPLSGATVKIHRLDAGSEAADSGTGAAAKVA